jgi:hypothetical protein
MGNCLAVRRTSSTRRNPIHAFARSAKRDGTDAYRTIFSNPAIGAPFHHCAKWALAAKRAQLKTPLLGEIYPFMLQGSCQLDDAIKHDLSVAWLSFYIYTVIVDSALDEKGTLSPIETMSASAYLALGTRLFSKYVLATPYEHVFIENVNRAFSGQAEDLRKRQSMRSDRRRSDCDKNRAIVACAAAFVAASARKPERLDPYAVLARLCSAGRRSRR